MEDEMTRLASYTLTFFKGVVIGAGLTAMAMTLWNATWSLLNLMGG